MNPDYIQPRYVKCPDTWDGLLQMAHDTVHWKDEVVERMNAGYGNVIEYDEMVGMEPLSVAAFINIVPLLRETLLPLPTAVRRTPDLFALCWDDSYRDSIMLSVHWDGMAIMVNSHLLGTDEALRVDMNDNDSIRRFLKYFEAYVYDSPTSVD